MGGGVFNSVAVSVDNVTTEISSGLLQIKDAGVTAAKLAAGVIGTGWKWIETKTITGSAVTSFDFAATLDGNTEEDYMIISRIVTVASDSIQLRMNGATAAGYSQQIIAVGSALATTDGGNYTIFATVYHSDSIPAYFVTVINCRTGLLKQYVSLGTSGYGAGHTRSYQYGGYIDTPNAATNCTSLGAYSYSAGNIGVGSTFVLYKRA